MKSEVGEVSWEGKEVSVEVLKNRGQGSPIRMDADEE